MLQWPGSSERYHSVPLMLKKNEEQQRGRKQRGSEMNHGKIRCQNIYTELDVYYYLDIL